VVSRLRRALGGEAARLVSSAAGYRLRVESDELDLGRFEPFAAPEVARLEDMRAAAVEDRVEADLAMGRGPSSWPSWKGGWRQSRCASACAGSSCSRLDAALAEAEIVGPPADAGRLQALERAERGRAPEDGVPRTSHPPAPRPRRCATSR
jgi:hypothetical protein